MSFSPIDVAVRSLILVALTFAFLPLLRRTSAAVRHTFLTITLFAILLLPFFSIALPRWEIDVPPSPRFVPTINVPPTANPIQPVATETTPQVAETPPPGIPVDALTLGIYVFGVVVCLFPLLLNQFRLHRFVHRCLRHENGPIFETVGTLARIGGIVSRITLYQAPDDTLPVPVTFGLFRPAILIPTTFSQWSEERQRMVLLHELAHIRRRDWAWMLFGQFVSALYWWNPFVRFLARRMDREAELACDDAVIAVGIPAPDYATQLLAVTAEVRHDRNRQAAGAVGITRVPSAIPSRVRAILDARRQRTGLSRRGIAGIVVAMALVSLPIALLRAQTQKVPTGPVITRQTLDDVTVEIIGIGGPHSKASQAWKPDGTLMKPPKEWAEWGTGDLRNWPTTPPPRFIVFEARNTTHDDYSVAVSFEPQSSFHEKVDHLGTYYLKKNPKNLPQPFSSNVAFVGNPGTITMRVGIGTAPWKTVAIYPFPAKRAMFAPHRPATVKPVTDRDFYAKADLIFHIEEHPTVTWTDKNGVAHKTDLLPGKSLRETEANRLTAVLKSGKEIPLQSSLTGSHNSKSYGLSFDRTAEISRYNYELDLNQVASFQLATRPYKWMEFRNIALNPKTKVNPGTFRSPANTSP